MLAALLLAVVSLCPQGTPVARGKGGLTLPRSTLESVLLDRYGYSEDGRELLELFLKSRLLENLASKSGVRVSENEVTQRWKELDRRSKAGGQALEDEIRSRNLTPDQFRDFLRLALLQEKLTRKALGLAPDKPVTGAQQEIWLQQEIAQRGLEVLPPAEGLGGIMARCGEVSVTRAEFAAFLLERLGREDVRESAWHMLLLEAIERRMPDLSPEARARAIEREVEHRRAEHRLEYPAITFEQRLGANGRTLETLRRDPSVAIAALSRLWVDRTSGEDGVRHTYEEDRDAFDARYGEAVRAALLFLVAGRFVNDLCPRTFEEAEHTLQLVAERVDSLPAFQQEVARLSEEPGTKQAGGDLGWVTRGDPRIPVELREALFHFLATGGELPPGGRALGPVRLESGVGLLWLWNRRPGPSWEEMSEHVHEELRRRFLEGLMPLDTVELLVPRE